MLVCSRIVYDGHYSSAFIIPNGPADRVCDNLCTRHNIKDNSCHPHGQDQHNTYTLIVLLHAVLHHIDGQHAFCRAQSSTRRRGCGWGTTRCGRDADAEALWEKVQVSKKPVGGILMDQTMIAGVGNIYRAEILFKVWVKAQILLRCWSRGCFASHAGCMRMSF